MLRKIKSTLYSAALLLGKIKFNNRDSKVLYYHDVHEDSDIPETLMSTPISVFLEHVRIIRESGFEIVDCITKPRNQIMITFDDGFKGVYKNKSILISGMIPITIFVITETIGQHHYLNINELRELEGMGIRIQSHTHTHPDLNLLATSELEFEMATSKKILENTVRSPITDLCFPKGLFTNDVTREAYKCGYFNLYSCIPGSFYEDNSFNVIFRNLVQFSSNFDFNCILFGGLNIFKKRYTKQHYNGE